MKKYIAPAVEMHEVASQHMMAVSFKVSDTETDQQLTKETQTEWDIWND